MTSRPALGRIITFYSYKGGTGRTQALANLAWVLAAARKKVLVMDWDLEAPGLHRYFHPFLVDKELTTARGLIDLLSDYADQAIQPPTDNTDDWYRELTDISPYTLTIGFDGFPEGGRIDFVPAGRQNTSYAMRVTGFDWDVFYERLGGGTFLEALKAKLRESYDYVLIDSRTGISDTAGICTVQMPSILVTLFTYNNQSMRGAHAVAQSARESRRKLVEQLSGEPFRIYPIPSRADPFETRKLQLRQHYARRLFDPLLEHIPELERNRYWSGVEIPYSAYLSYEEVLAPLVFDADDPKFPLAATLRLCAHVTDGAVTQYSLPLAPEKRQALLLAFEQVDNAAPEHIQTQAAAPATEESPADQYLRNADETLAQLDASALLAARALLLKLVRQPTPLETAGLKRLRISVDQLSETERDLLDRFLKTKLLKIGEETGSQRTVAEFTDEQLPTRWRQLNAWADEDKAILEQRDWVQAALLRWHRSNRSDEQLMTPQLADQTAKLAASHPDYFTADEHNFIQLSVKHAERVRLMSTLSTTTVPRTDFFGWAKAAAVIGIAVFAVVSFFEKTPTQPDNPIITQPDPSDKTSTQQNANNNAAFGFYFSGNQYFLEKRYDQALKNFDRAIELQPDYFEAYLSRADTYQQLGKREQAINNLEDAIRINPKAIEAYLKLAKLYASMNNKDKAIALYQHALSLNPAPEIKTRAESELQALKTAIKRRTQSDYQPLKK